eukprot:TRINITY_DN18133_c0_g1_i1.p1 TRINITY_DN18133_c0_g1~~TRINITY_DN18133_c0_g1_i1.p1  ORF type:complete len:300 (-),score=69.39 TRINITY_DN18133_c0_g1_i1:112-1011(-)
MLISVNGTNFPTLDNYTFDVFPNASAHAQLIEEANRNWEGSRDFRTRINNGKLIILVLSIGSMGLGFLCLVVLVISWKKLQSELSLTFGVLCAIFAAIAMSNAGAHFSEGIRNGDIVRMSTDISNCTFPRQGEGIFYYFGCFSEPSMMNLNALSFQMITSMNDTINLFSLSAERSSKGDLRAYRNITLPNIVTFRSTNIAKKEKPVNMIKLSEVAEKLLESLKIILRLEGCNFVRTVTIDFEENYGYNTYYLLRWATQASVSLGIAFVMFGIGFIMLKDILDKKRREEEKMISRRDLNY